MRLRISAEIRETSARRESGPRTQTPFRVITGTGDVSGAARRDWMSRSLLIRSFLSCFPIRNLQEWDPHSSLQLLASRTILELSSSHHKEVAASGAEGTHDREFPLSGPYRETFRPGRLPCKVPHPGS